MPRSCQGKDEMWVCLWECWSLEGFLWGVWGLCLIVARAGLPGSRVLLPVVVKMGVAYSS